MTESDIAFDTTELWADIGEEADVSVEETPGRQRGAVAELADQLHDEPWRLGLRLRELAEQENAHILLFVDQLEELHTLIPEPERRERFMEAICSAGPGSRSSMHSTSPWASRNTA